MTPTDATADPALTYYPNTYDECTACDAGFACIQPSASDKGYACAAGSFCNSYAPTTSPRN